MTATASKKKRGRKIQGPAANVQRKPGAAPKWDVEMQQRIIDAVKDADKRGLPRKHVFEKLAAEFNEEYAETYTEHQVASQFHLVKARFGYLVDRQVQKPAQPRVRKLTLPPTKSQYRSLDAANRKIDELHEKLARKDSNLAVMRAKRNETLTELQELRRRLRAAGLTFK